MTPLAGSGRFTKEKAGPRQEMTPEDGNPVTRIRLSSCPSTAGQSPSSPRHRQRGDYGGQAVERLSTLFADRHENSLLVADLDESYRPTMDRAGHDVLRGLGGIAAVSASAEKAEGPLATGITVTSPFVTGSPKTLLTGA